MNVVFKKAFRFNLEELSVIEIPLTNQDNDLETYINDLLIDVYNSTKSKKYLFPDEPTAIKSSMYEIVNGSYDFPTSNIAKRLLKEEVFVQKKIEHLDTEVQKGILVQSLIELEETKCFIIIKAEHLDFINENDNRKAKGLPIKKKIFKSFCSFFDESDLPTYAMVSDSGSKIAPYWWQRFLELIEEHTDEYNTVEAFDAIDKKIFSNYQNSYPEDYMNLRNATVNYFRVNEEFIMDDYIERIIKNYEPENSQLNITQIEVNIRKLPESQNFDSRFTIIKGLLRKRIIKQIYLTPQLVLEMKEDVNLITDVKGFIENGIKYIKIRTEKGYNYFPKEEQ